ncbi:MAG: Ig-like domain-containing protein [Phycisphaerae bacterium]|nr:Ig-like domain-containing protein [Phycisphaerae bacterium]
MRTRHQSAVVWGALLTCVIGRPLPAETVWFGLEKDSPYEDTAQRFASSGGSPDLVIGNNFDSYGSYYNLAVSGSVLYGGSSYTVHKWNAETGAYIGQLSLSSPLSSHLESFLSGIGTSITGDLLFTTAGYSTNQRTVARYSATGTWLCDYTTSALQHAQGTATANSEALFVASRYDIGSGWTEKILMFELNGTFVGVFGSENGGVGDVAIMGGQLYSLDYGDGIRVYDLNGTSLPTYSHLVSFPVGVNPSDTYTDEIHAWGGNLYVEDDGDNAWYKINLSGTLLATYSGETRGTYNTTGSLAVFSTGGDTTPPAVTGRSPAPGSTVTTSGVNVDVTFSEAVAGVDGSDMELSGTAAGSASVGTPNDLGANTWRFPISGLVSGTLSISLAPDANDIEDLAGNDLANVIWSYTVDIPTPPTPQAAPYAQDFSSGKPGAAGGWEYYSSDSYGRIEVQSGRLRMDRSPDGSYTLNEAVLHLDLAGRSGVTLSFFQADYGDEEDTLSGTFTGHANGDGVAVSTDGVTWHTVVTATELNVGTSGQAFVVDLDALGLAYTSDFQVKFQQYDNYAYDVDGREWDDVEVTVTLPHSLTITFNDPTRGSVEFDPEPNDANSPEYMPGTLVTLLAVPVPGKAFKYWTFLDPNYPGDANYGVTDANYRTMVLMDEDKEILATFNCGMGMGPMLPMLTMMLGMLGLLLRVKRRA